jgi:hypothetical protein
MRTRRVVEEQIMVPVPRSALMVAAPPSTVTQRNCFEVFGLKPADYLRLAGRAFPVKKEGKLRVAKHADVETYLTSGASFVEKYHRRPPKVKVANEFDAVDALDVHAVLRKAGFRRSP